MSHMNEILIEHYYLLETINNNKQINISNLQSY